MRHPTHLFERAFNRLGYQIGQHPQWIIGAVVVISIVAGIGLFRFEEVNNVRTEYSPTTAPSRREYEVAKQFLKQNGTLDPCYIMTRANDGGNLLRPEYRLLLYNLTRAIQQEVHVVKRGRVYGYRDLCEPYCELNTAFLAFLKVYDPAQPLTHTYPAVELFGTRVFIGNNVYGVVLKNISASNSNSNNNAADDIGQQQSPSSSSSSISRASSSSPIVAAASSSQEVTEEEQALLLALEANAKNAAGTVGKQQPTVKLLEGFTTAVMPFFLVADYEDKELLVKWQNAAIELFERPQYSKLLKTGMTSDNLVTKEVRRMGSETAPLLATSVVFMIIFVVCTSFRVKRSENRFFECLIGCLIPVLAMATAIGLMATFGYKFQSIIVAALFLVLSVGVDDIFILMRAWHRTNEEHVHRNMFSHSSSPNLASVPSRMAICLEDAGPSITISSLTNVISFAIGAFSDTPAVRTFCIFSASAISICWLYQLVLLSAVVCFNEKRRVRKSQQVQQQKFAPTFYQMEEANGDYCLVAARAERLQKIVVEFWALAVTKWTTRILLALFMVFYFVLCWFGIRRLQSNISIDKMALPNSYLHDFQLQFEMALRSMQPISVFVLQPGDMRDPQQLARIKQLIWDFEHALNSYGPESTFFWLHQYEDFLRFYTNGNENEEEKEIDPAEQFDSPRFTYTEIPAFFKSAAYFYLSSFVHYNESECRANRPECIRAFFFVTNFHRVIKYHELVPTVTEWRRIAAHYADMKVYAYSDHTPFVDQTIAIDQTVFGSVAAALVCTCLVCLLFIPHFLSVVAAVFSVFSISWGIFGLLVFWGIDLDPLSMASLLMAIGFSVDFTAHISYHYYKATEGTPRMRMQQALTIIGYPMVQVGISTIVALLPLLFKQSYLAMVFLKTIIVVVALGMFHGLILLPAVLTALPSSSSRITQKKPPTNPIKNNLMQRKLGDIEEAEQPHQVHQHQQQQQQQIRHSGRSAKSNSNFSASGSSSSDAGLGSSSGDSSCTNSSNLCEDSASERRIKRRQQHQQRQKKQCEINRINRLSTIDLPATMPPHHQAAHVRAERQTSVQSTRTTTSSNNGGALALVHRIQLGRSASNAI